MEDVLQNEVVVPPSPVEENVENVVSKLKKSSRKIRDKPDNRFMRLSVFKRKLNEIIKDHRYGYQDVHGVSKKVLERMHQDIESACLERILDIMKKLVRVKRTMKRKTVSDEMMDLIE
jgi:hypothetical protein